MDDDTGWLGTAGLHREFGRTGFMAYVLFVNLMSVSILGNG
jgi:hypothetical protein